MSSSNAYSYTPARELSASRREPMGLGLRLRVLAGRRRLDGRLAEGADPGTSAELSLRARQLTRVSYRRALADSFDEILCIAEGSGLRAGASPPLAGRDIRAARAALLELSRALRRHGPVGVLGVALAQRLLTDGTGPLYVESRDDALWQALRRAVAALELHA